jgi:hypothetical protein
MRHLKTARAYRIRLAFQELYEQPSTDAGADFLQRWYFWATHRSAAADRRRRPQLRFSIRAPRTLGDFGSISQTCLNPTGRPYRTKLD